MKRQRPEDARSGVGAPDDVDRLLHAAASVTETLSWKNTALQRSLERAAPPLLPGGAAAASSGALAPLSASQPASTSPRVLYKWPMMAESDFESLTMRTPFSVVALISSWL